MGFATDRSHPVDIALATRTPYHEAVKTESSTSRHRRHGRRLVLIPVALTLLAGCATGGSARNPFDPSDTGGTGSEEPIRIEVQNLNFNDVTVWAMRQGQRIRLGRVTGKTDHTFRVDWNLAIPISFVVDVTGGRSCTTGGVGVDRDARVWVAVPSNVGSQPCRAGRR